MGILSNLQPERVFYYFEQIAQIPHGSGNIRQISDYLVSCARKMDLEYVQDADGNVIIKKPAASGYEQEPVVILQGHMDMVAVKTTDSAKDMLTEGLDLAIDGDYIYAKNTTLGGDDGIALAYALAILEDKSLQHPALEVIATVDEEIGLLGAGSIDLSDLKGHRMINLDSEEEGIFWTSCAGGASTDCTLQVHRELCQGMAVQVTVDGLLGGHSGAEIHKERGNSNVIMARILYAAASQMPLYLISLNGGLADNAIPRRTQAMVLLETENAEEFCSCVKQLEVQITDELGVKDPDFFVETVKVGQRSEMAVPAAEVPRLLQFLVGLPGGIMAMSADVPGLVETSLNMGVLRLEEEALHAQFSVRSSVESAKNALLQKLEAITALAGGEAKTAGEYPGWKYRVDSPLREKMIRVYQNMYGKLPKVEAIHAGLECGILGSKIEDLDCVSMGPDMFHVHTTEERLSIASTARVWEYLVQLLAEKD